MPAGVASVGSNRVVRNKNGGEQNREPGKHQKQLPNMILRLSIFLFFLTALFSSCGKDPFQSGNTIPSAFGDINQLVVVMADSAEWRSPLGDTVDSYFAGPFMIVPTPEPLFDIKFLEANRLMRQDILRQYRNYVIPVNLANENSETTRMVEKYLGAEKIRTVQEAGGYKTFVNRNLWASDQTVYYIVGTSEDKLIEGLQANAPGIVNQIKREQEERHRATAFAVKGENMNLRRQVVTDLGVDFSFPNDFKLAVQDTTDQVVWLRQDEGTFTNNIFLKKVPYENREQLTPAYARELLENTGARYVKSTVQGSFKKIDDINLPLLTDATTINGNFALELRGIWEMENDAMAGPFVAYLIHNPTTNELLLAEGFIFAPGEDKRNAVEQLEVLLRGIRFV